MARKPKRDLTVEEQLARGPMDLPFLMLVMILLGIGLIMMGYIKQFRYHSAMGVILLVAVIVILVDLLTNFLRKKVLA